MFKNNNSSMNRNTSSVTKIIVPFSIQDLKIEILRFQDDSRRSVTVSSLSIFKSQNNTLKDRIRSSNSTIKPGDTLLLKICKDRKNIKVVVLPENRNDKKREINFSDDSICKYVDAEITTNVQKLIDSSLMFIEQLKHIKENEEHNRGKINEYRQLMKTLKNVDLNLTKYFGLYLKLGHMTYRDIIFQLYCLNINDFPALVNSMQLINLDRRCDIQSFEIKFDKTENKDLKNDDTVIGHGFSIRNTPIYVYSDEFIKLKIPRERVENMKKHSLQYHEQDETSNEFEKTVFNFKINTERLKNSFPRLEDIKSERTTSYRKENEGREEDILDDKPKKINTHRSNVSKDAAQADSMSQSHEQTLDRIASFEDQLVKSRLESIKPSLWEEVHQLFIPYFSENNVCLKLSKMSDFPIIVEESEVLKNVFTIDIRERIPHEFIKNIQNAITRSDSQIDPNTVEFKSNIENFILCLLCIYLNCVQKQSEKELIIRVLTRNFTFNVFTELKTLLDGYFKSG